MNSKAQGLLEAQLACKLFGLTMNASERFYRKTSKVSPFNSRVRLTVRHYIASQKTFPNHVTRQQIRAARREGRVVR